MAIRYNRYLDDSIKKSIVERLKFLFDFSFMDDSDAVDIHIREKNELMLYHGGTCVLIIKLAKLNKKGFISLSAHKTYKDKYKSLMREWEVSDDSKLSGLKEAYVDYLKTIIEKVNKKYYKNKKEGFWNNKICIEFSRYWAAEMDWLIIDRECVLGFESKSKKKDFYNKAKSVYGTIEKEMRTQDSDKWGNINRFKDYGDELDILAIGPNKELICIELKHGSNTSGIYWGPLQTSVYRDAFTEALADISGGIKTMVNQKIDLGLLPEDAKKRLPDGNFTNLKGILLVAAPKEKSRCWNNLKEVQNKLFNIPKKVVGVKTINEKMELKSVTS